MASMNMSGRFHLFFHFLSCPLIVIIQEGYPLAARCAHTHIPSLGSPYGFSKLNQPHPFVINTSQRAHSLRIWAIDDHYDLKTEITLNQCACYRAHYPLRSSTRGDDHAH